MGLPISKDTLEDTTQSLNTEEIQRIWNDPNTKTIEKAYMGLMYIVPPEDDTVALSYFWDRLREDLALDGFMMRPAVGAPDENPSPFQDQSALNDPEKKSLMV